MKLLFSSVIIIFCGLLLDVFINLYLECLILSVEICLLLRNLSHHVEKYAIHVVYSDDDNWYPDA